MYRTLAATAVALLLAVPTGLHGQATLQSAVGFGGFAGDDYDGVEAGYSIGGGLLFDASENIQVGGEVFVHTFGLEGTAENLDHYDILAKARYLIPGDPARFFIGAKAGYARQSFGPSGAEVESDGFTVGPTVGVSIPVSSFMLELSGDALWVTQGYADDVADPIDDASGVRYAISAGLAIPLGAR